MIADAPEPSLSTAPEAVISAADWRERMRAHRERVGTRTQPARERKDRGIPHPVEDFLFQYYPFPLSLLENWQPGTGVMLEWVEEDGGGEEAVTFNPRYYTRLREEDGKMSAEVRPSLREEKMSTTRRPSLLYADPSLLTEKERQRMGWIRDLLAATASRLPMFSCHGLHEWAMVYGGKQVRHEKTTPLRLPQAEIDALVASRPVCCSHHDAFRFFAAEARPFNRLQPSLDTRMELEQPGCVHANMDLYKWSAKLMPWVGSDLLVDAFELATELRDLDMRASPYDLSAWGREPIRIETAEGRRVYETEQKRLAFAAMGVRARLIGKIDLTLGA